MGILYLNYQDMDSKIDYSVLLKYFVDIALDDYEYGETCFTGILRKEFSNIPAGYMVYIDMVSKTEWRFSYATVEQVQSCCGDVNDYVEWWNEPVARKKMVTINVSVT